MNQMDEKLLTDMQESITNGLKEGRIKMGNTIPFTHYIGTSLDGEVYAPTFTELVITPNYMKDLRNRYEKMVKT